MLKNVEINKLSDNSDYYNMYRVAKVTSTMHKTDWFYHKARSGVYGDVIELYAKEYSDIIESISSVITSIHGDNWDYFMGMNETKVEPRFPSKYIPYGGVEFAIHYPKIEISNSVGISHDITDLYVVIEVEFHLEDGILIPYFSRPKGFRTTLSHEEDAADYLHSHLSSSNLNFIPDTFCIGTSDLMDLTLGLNEDYTPEIFELYLLTLNSFVSWESLEGIPYKYMNTITSQQGLTHYTSNYGRFKILYKRFTRRLKEEDEKPLLNYSYNEGEIGVDIDETFKSMVDNFSGVDQVVKYRGGYYTFSGINNSSTAQERVLKSLGSTIFRGREVTLRILSSETSKIKHNYITHPKFLKYVKERIDRDIHEGVTRKIALEEYNKTLCS